MPSESSKRSSSPEKKKKAKKALKTTANQKQIPSAIPRTNACFACNKTEAETPKDLMLTCKTCGVKMHTKCYDNTHFSKKFATGWECVECKKCEVCKSADYKEDNEILFCNRCDKGYHQLCCSEKFRKVPEGDTPWFCESCHTYLKEKKQRKKRKIEKTTSVPVIVAKSESTESLFKLKPYKAQRAEENKPKEIEAKQPSIQPITPSPTPSSTSVPSIATPKTNSPIINNNTTTNGVKNVTKEIQVSVNGTQKDQHAQTDTVKDRISVFIIYNIGEKTFYSCNCPIPMLPVDQSEKHATQSSNYFKELKSIVLKRLNIKIEDMIEDETTENDTKKMLQENTLPLKRLSLKAKDRFNSDLKVELDRLYFEDYALCNGDTLFVELSVVPRGSN